MDSENSVSPFLKVIPRTAGVILAVKKALQKSLDFGVHIHDLNFDFYDPIFLGQENFQNQGITICNFPL